MGGPRLHTARLPGQCGASLGWVPILRQTEQFRCHAANAKVPLPSTGVYGTKVPPDRLGRVLRAREPVASCGALDVLAGFGLPGCLEEVMRRHVRRKGETNSFVGRTLWPPSGNHKGCPTRTLCTSY